MRYFLIDRVVYLEYNKRLTALKNVALSEDVYADHFYGSYEDRLAEIIASNLSPPSRK